MLLQQRDSAKLDFTPDVNGLLHSSHGVKQTVCWCVRVCFPSGSTSVQESVGCVLWGLVVCELAHLNLHRAASQRDYAPSQVTVTATCRKMIMWVTSVKSICVSWCEYYSSNHSRLFIYHQMH